MCPELTCYEDIKKESNIHYERNFLGLYLRKINGKMIQAVKSQSIISNNQEYRIVENVELKLSSFKSLLLIHTSTFHQNRWDYFCFSITIIVFLSN